MNINADIPHRRSIRLKGYDYSFKDILNDMDVPMLTLDCDVVDPTFTSEEEVREKLEQFFELLEDR